MVVAERTTDGVDVTDALCLTQMGLDGQLSAMKTDQ